MNVRTIMTIVLVLFVAIPSQAQEQSNSFREQGQPVFNNQSRSFQMLSGATIAATAFDVETTMNVLKVCSTCFEANPLMRPFVNSRSTAYGAAMGISSVSMWASYKLKQEDRKWWWVPLVGQIGLHVAAGMHNQAIAGQRR